MWGEYEGMVLDSSSSSPVGGRRGEPRSRSVFIGTVEHEAGQKSIFINQSVVCWLYIRLRFRSQERMGIVCPDPVAHLFNTNLDRDQCCAACNHPSSNWGNGGMIEEPL